MIRKNMKLIIGLMIGIIVSGFGVYAANSLSANSISIDKSKMSKVENNNLQSALDYLYDKSSKTNMITIESGVEHDYQTYLGIAYLDPTNLENKCTSANSVSLTGTKTGCMKWYIYKDLGDSYKMILDHNTTARQAWNTKGEYGINVAFAPNETGDSTYDNLVYNEVKLLNTAVADGGSGWVVEPDLISAEEVAEIAGYNGFINTNTWICLDSKEQGSINNCVKQQGTSNYAWLFNYVRDCTNYGCNIKDSSNLGYWTKTSVGEAGTGIYIFIVDRYGSLDYNHASTTGYGVRPVIQVSKSIFN